MSILSFIYNSFTNIYKLINRLIDKISEYKNKSKISTYNLISYDSRYRNRLIYTYPSDFVVTCNNTNNQIDPVCESFPVNVGLFSNNGTNSIGYISKNSPNFINYYINNYIILFNGDSSIISSYNPTTFKIDFSPPLTHSTTVLNDPYIICKKLPIFQGTATYSGTKKVILSNNFSSGVWANSALSDKDDFYVGMYIVNYNTLNISTNTTGIYDKVSSKIISYNGTTKEAVLDDEIYPNSGFFYCLICQFSYNNNAPLYYSGSYTIKQQICYNVQLLQLTVPSSILKVGHGGRLTSYPYIYVHLYNDKYAGSVLYGNNPNANIATFKLVIDGTSVVQSEDGSIFPWIYFNNMAQSAIQTIKLNLLEPIRIKVTLPNGEILKYVNNLVYPPPSIPNPLNRISMLLAFGK